MNPFYFARRALRRELGGLAPRVTGELLDVGCGRKPYRDLFPGVTRYVGIDFDTPVTRGLGCADLLYDGRRFPLGDATFDAVLCSQVLEHVFTPEEFVRELHRVLRPGGLLLLTVPFVWDEHEQPHDYARYSSFGLADLLHRAGFEIVEHRKTLPDVRALAQLAAAYVYKAFAPSRFLLRLPIQVFLITPCTLLGVMLGPVLPRNEDLFLDHVVLARKPSNA